MRAILILGALLLLGSCNQEPVFNPKPRSFPKVNYPERGYSQFDKDYCDFTFNYPSYATIEKDNSFFDEKPVSECWFNIQLPPFDGTLYCSYVPLHNRTEFDKMVNDAYTMVGKHNIKAEYRDEFPIQKGDVAGMLFEMEGEVASNLQFYLTDTTQHFFRASLYFNSQVNPDSIAPIYDFVKADVMEMIASFEWNN